MTGPDPANAHGDHDRWPPDDEMRVSNRRLLAEGWPDGALDACERIDAGHPGWSTMWRDVNEWSGSRAGFYAHHERRPGSRIWDGPVYGATEDDVTAEIEVWVPVEPPPFRPLV